MYKPAIKSKPAPPGPRAPKTARPRIPARLLAALLVLVTIAIYWPATRCDFINFDDPTYVTENPHVQSGLNWESVKWAFLNPVSANWHPLTILSHMSDCQLFGLKPWGHHLINVLFHSLNAALVFALLRQLTGATWRSLLVAALFAFHPLHVESVAWVAERKDVLSGFFGLLALICYARYAKDCDSWSAANGRWSIFHLPLVIFYLLCLFFLTLGLMSKPMLVTWPFVMLLLDYWPLERFKHGNVWRLVTEKIPFFVLVTVASIVTFVMQKHGGAVPGQPPGARAGNALISYCRYLGKLFWPTDLAVFYPHPWYWPLEQVLLAGVLILTISVLLFAKRQRYPFMLMGWLWFLGTLVPVIGLVPVGVQAMADRYTYIPSLGVLILAIWGADEMTRPWRHRVIALSVAGSAAIVMCLGLTRQQLGHWRDSETLFRHALAVTENNQVGHDNLGNALLEKNQIDEAIRQYQEAIRLAPDFAEPHYNLGIAFGKNGQMDEAIRQFQEVIRLKPDNTDAHYSLGTAYGMMGQIDGAISQFHEVIRLKPDFAEAHNNLGIALVNKNQIDEAINQFQEAIRLKPDCAEAHNNLGIALVNRGRFDEAIVNYQKAIQIEPNFSDALNNLAWMLAASPDDELRNGTQAVRLAERACELTHHGEPFFMGTLAAAYAEAGRFPEAVATAEKAEQLATSAGLTAVAAKNRQRLELYRAGKPYHEPAAH
jgi:tetratricopeptide (TPR) repeat protein